MGYFTYLSFNNCILIIYRTYNLKSKYLLFFIVSLLNLKIGNNFSGQNLDLLNLYLYF